MKYEKIDYPICIRRTKWWYWALACLWDIIVYGTFTYLIFWKEAHGAWYLFAILITMTYHNHEDED